MPHIVIDYSAGLETRHDMQALCDALFAAMAADPAIPDPTSLKIRARPHDFFRFGTEPQSFAHAELFLLAGRDDATKAGLTATILRVMDQMLPDVGSLSVDVADMARATYAKRVL